MLVRFRPPEKEKSVRSKGKGTLVQPLGRWAAGGDEAFLVQPQVDPGDVAPIPCCLGEGGFKDGAVGALGLLDLEGEDVGGRQRVGAVDVGEDRRLARPIVPLKAKSFPLEGKGDCSGKTTLAEKEPSPTKELLQASRASWLVEGLMWLIRQWGMPRRSM